MDLQRASRVWDGWTKQRQASRIVPAPEGKQRRLRAARRVLVRLFPSGVRAFSEGKGSVSEGEQARHRVTPL